ncbi:unnamed protein product [Prorocentrum cordatum]|uniref:Uncharacterized protein n=1 Tax=Prorocentrum cordatum TaxID=2364126 RepID=A0ABN9QE67_9DINO|nr:unnamed protein product [Polarella glacialis]
MLRRYVEELSDQVSPCESKVQTPVPQSYVRHSGRLLTVWLVALPLPISYEMHWWTVVIEFLISWGLFGIYEIGLRLEDPFNGQLPVETFIKTSKKEIDERYLALIEKMRQRSGSHERLAVFVGRWAHRCDSRFFRVLQRELLIAAGRNDQRAAALVVVRESVKRWLSARKMLEEKHVARLQLSVSRRPGLPFYIRTRFGTGESITAACVTAVPHCSADGWRCAHSSCACACADHVVYCRKTCAPALPSHCLAMASSSE